MSPPTRGQHPGLAGRSERIAPSVSFAIATSREVKLGGRKEDVSRDRCHAGRCGGGWYRGTCTVVGDETECTNHSDADALKALENQCDARP